MLYFNLYNKEQYGSTALSLTGVQVGCFRKLFSANKTPDNSQKKWMSFCCFHSGVMLAGLRLAANNLGQ